MPTHLLQARAGARLARAHLQPRLSARPEAEIRHRVAYYRELWVAAARDVGVPISPLPDGGAAVSLPSEQVTVRGTYCSIDGPEVLERAGDKLVLHRLLGAAGLPTPPHRPFTLKRIDVARRFLAESPDPCVVKPAKDSGAGNGVTTGLRRLRELHLAAAAAASVGVQTGRNPGGYLGRYRQLATVPLLIERQITGANYRLLYLDGVLVDAIRRGQPTVVGDGRTTVAGLLDRVNTQRLQAGGYRAQLLLSRDVDGDVTLAAQGLRWTSVPGAGVVVRIKTTINQNAPQDNHPARDELCAAVIAQGARAAAAVGARWAGVDVITTDPAVPLEESGGCILEVNTTPGLAMHQHGRPGAVEPAKVLLAYLAEAASPVDR